MNIIYYNLQITQLNQIYLLHTNTFSIKMQQIKLQPTICTPPNEQPLHTHTHRLIRHIVTFS